MNINKEIKPPSSVDFQKKSPRRPDDRSSSRDAAVAPAATAATELLLLRSSSLRHFSRCRRVAAASLILEVLPVPSSTSRRNATMRRPFECYRL